MSETRPLQPSGQTPEAPSAAQSADLAIIGGGLAGLSLAIQLAQAGFAVVLFEQKRYPFQRVCGEYIALESLPFLERLGLPLGSQIAAGQLPRIHQLLVSSPRGQSLRQPLQPGGFGISRYTLDSLMAQQAEAVGVKLLQGTAVRDVKLLPNDTFEVHTANSRWQVRQVCGAYGKHASLDRQLRPQAMPVNTGVPTWVGIKYHVQMRWQPEQIALHNFKGGYCGMSAIEAGKCCVCYLVSQQALEQVGGDIARLEAERLSQNPYLKSVFAHAQRLFERPQAIAQIHFQPRSLIENHVLLLGDAAGMIPPLCGNGMSMALRASAMLAPLLAAFLAGQLSRPALEASYTQQWQVAFGLRLRVGRLLQHSFGKSLPSELLVRGLQPLPWVKGQLVGLTHGPAF